MPLVKFNTYVSAEAKQVWGYDITERTEEGVFGEVPDELVEIEVSSGRVKLVSKQDKPEVTEDKPLSAAEVVEGTGKRGPGRPAKAE